MQSIIPNEIKVSIFERAYDKKYVLFISFISLYIDIVHYHLTGKNILHLKLSDIDKLYSFGSVLVFVVIYFLVIYASHYARLAIMFVFWKPLNYIYTITSKDEIDLIARSEYVNKDKVLNYARKTDNSVLADEYIQKTRLVEEGRLLENISFLVILTLFIDTFFEGLLLNTTILPLLNEVYYIISFYMFLFFLLVANLVPSVRYCEYLYLPDHELSSRDKPKPITNH